MRFLNIPKCSSWLGIWIGIVGQSVKDHIQLKTTNGLSLRSLVCTNPSHYSVLIFSVLIKWIYSNSKYTVVEFTFHKLFSTTQFDYINPEKIKRKIHFHHRRKSFYTPNRSVLKWKYSSHLVTIIKI